MEQRLTIGRLTEEGKAYLTALSGLDFMNYVDISLSSSDLRHVFNDHYGANEKDRGNNYPLTDDDIKNIADVIAAPNKVLFLGYDIKRQSNKFAFLKQSPNGTYNLMEVYGDKGGSLIVKSLFHTKKEISQRISDIEKQLKYFLNMKRLSFSESMKSKDRLFSTSETYSDASPLLLAKVPLFVDYSNYCTAKVIENFENPKKIAEKDQREKQIFQKATPSATLQAVNKLTNLDVPKTPVGKKNGKKI
ncbi:hypothetical protein FACS1894199_02900 [Bacteroidia bacterium]|nr:hypothetical protein FACS1894199_02900 [Bacteroidia bacterium]